MEQTTIPGAELQEPEKPKRQSSKLSKELSLVRRITEALSELDRPARMRVMGYVNSWAADEDVGPAQAKEEDDLDL